MEATTTPRGVPDRHRTRAADGLGDSYARTVPVLKLRHALWFTDGALMFVAICILSLQAVLAERGATYGAAIDDVGLGLLSAASLCAAITLRAPMVGAVGALACTIAWYQLGYSSSIVNVPHLVAFFLLGLSGNRARQTLVGIAAIVATLGVMAIESGESAGSVAAALGGTITAVLLGEATRSRREHIVAYATRANRAEAEREAEAERRVAAARLEIARDLHDVLAHTLSVMTVQASVAQDAMERGTGHVGAALDAIKAAGQDASREVGALVAVLRGDAKGAPVEPVPKLDQIDELAAAIVASGIDVEFDVTVDVSALSDLAHVTIYRIVQEALTNVARYADATLVVVSVSSDRADLVVEVVDDGRGGRSGAVAGFGIQGMHERVAAIGGRLTAGSRADRDGWVVRAEIPGRAGVVV